jgi:cytochrome P450 family 6
MGLIFKTLLLDVQLLAVCVFALLYAYFKLSYTYWKKRNVPYIKPKFPFGNLGDALLFRKSIGQTYENIYKKLEGEKYGGIYAFAKPRFIFRDPDIIKNILVKDFSSFHDRGFYMDEELEPMTGHLFLLPGNRWRNLRIKLSPTFTSGKMKMMFQTFVECAQELGSILEKSTCNEETLEINDTLARYSTDIISSCAFGIQCNSLKNPNAELRQWGRKLFETSFRNTVIRIFNHSTPGFLHVLNLKPVDPIVSKYFRRMVEETVNYRENNSFKRNDFMQLLIQIKNKVKLEEENDSLELNGHEILDKKPSEDGMYFQGYYT